MTPGFPTQRTPVSEGPFALTTPATQGADNEDALAIGPGVAVVVDGAGLPADLRRGCDHAVSWFARHVAEAFRDRLALRSSSMPQALADAITEVASLHGSGCDLALGSRAIDIPG